MFSVTATTDHGVRLSKPLCAGDSFGRMTTCACVTNPTTRIVCPHRHSRRCRVSRRRRTHETGMAPRAHLLDQFRRDHWFFEKKEKNGGLKELPQDGDVDVRCGKEPAISIECAGRRQDVKMRMPVQKLSGRPDRNDRAGKGVRTGVGADVRGDGVPGAQGEFRKEGAAIPEGRAERLRKGEHEVAVRHVADDVLPERILPTGRRTWPRTKDRIPAACRKIST